MMLNRLIFFMLMLSTVSVAFAADGVQQQFEGFNLDGYTTGGEKAWEINGDTADVSDATIKINNVKANSYGKQKTNLTARTGEINKVSGNVHLQDNVVITSVDRGTQLTTDSLDWNRTQDIVSTVDPVKIKDDSMTVTGTGMTAHPSMKIASLSEDVTAKLKTQTAGAPETGQSVSITCDGPMEVDQLKFYAVFNKNVVAIEVKSGRELRADKMEIYFDQRTNKIKKMICTGNVMVKQGTNVTYAELLTYNSEEQKMVLTGRTKLILDMAEGGGTPFGGLDMGGNK